MILLDYRDVLTILLMFLRVFSFVVMVPMFGAFALPGFVRAYFALALALSIFFLNPVERVEVSSVAQLIGIALSEISLGFIAGFFLRLLFESFFVAGEIIAIQSGLGFAMIFLPEQPQTSVLAGFSIFFASALFLALGGAHMVYIGLLKSFEGFPVGSFNLFSLDGELFLKLFYESFSLGFKLALPVLIATLITNVVLAVINRFIPQINVFMVGLPLQLALGLIVFMISLPALALVMANHIRDYMIDFVIFLSGG